MDKLNHIHTDLDYIKDDLSDVDLFLTDDDTQALQKAEDDLIKGKTKRLV